MKRFAANSYTSVISIENGGHIGPIEHLTAQFTPCYRDGMRTKHGRRRLQRFIDRLQRELDQFEVMYGKG